MQKKRQKIKWDESTREKDKRWPTFVQMITLREVSHSVSANTYNAQLTCSVVHLQSDNGHKNYARIST